MAKRPPASKSKSSSDAPPDLLSLAPRDRADPAAPKPLQLTTRLDQIVGQAQPISILRRSLASSRLHHAWIFAGPVGVGKRSTALAFAAALLDPSLAPNLAGQLDIDPDSSTQNLIKAAAHPDLHIITKELAALSREDNVRKSKQAVIPKEVVEEFLIEPAVRKRSIPAPSSAAKVFIIDEAELLGAPGQNALLKTVEEPPEGAVIIFITSSEDRLLATIRSRCQRIAFAPLSDAQMREWIAAARLPLDPAHLPWLLQYAQGSPGNLLLALDNRLIDWHTTLEPLLAAADKGAFTPELGSILAKLVDERAADWIKHNKDASKDAANKAWTRRMFAFIADRTRARLRAYAQQKSSPIPPSDPLIDRYLHILAVLDTSEELLWANVSIALVFENLAAQIIAEPVPRY